MLDLTHVQFSKVHHDEPVEVTDFYAIHQLNACIRMSPDGMAETTEDQLHEMLKDHIWHSAYAELKDPVCELVNLAQMNSNSLMGHEEADRLAGIIFGLLDRKPQTKVAGNSPVEV